MPNTKTQRKPGDHTLFANAYSGGSHENHLGMGEIDVSLYAPQYECPHIGIVSVSYANVSPQMRNVLDNMPLHYPSEVAADVNRRVSRPQAEYVALLIQQMLVEKLGCDLPSDEELKTLMPKLKQEMGIL